MAGIELATGELVSNNNYDHMIRLNGVSGFVFSVRNRGQQITVSGWNETHWQYKEGQSVLLIQNDGKETRYMIDKVTHCGDPADQYFIECSFYPRHNAQPTNKK